VSLRFHVVCKHSRGPELLWRGTAWAGWGTSRSDASRRPASIQCRTPDLDTRSRELRHLERKYISPLETQLGGTKTLRINCYGRLVFESWWVDPVNPIFPFSSPKKMKHPRGTHVDLPYIVILLGNIGAHITQAHRARLSSGFQVLGQ